MIPLKGEKFGERGNKRRKTGGGRMEGRMNERTWFKK
jgi:hypothetical protein